MKELHMGYLSATLSSFDCLWDLLTCQPVDMSTCHPINGSERIAHACKTWTVIGKDVGKGQWSRH